MQVNISNLKEIIKDCPDDRNVFIHIKEYEEYEFYYVERISSDPIFLDFEVRKGNKNIIKVSKIKNAIERYDDDSYIGFTIIDPRFEISRRGAFDVVKTDMEGNLHFYTYIPPRTVN